MDKAKIINLAQSSATLVLGPNQARRGFRVEPLNLSSPVVTVYVRPLRAPVLTDVSEVQTITPSKAPTAGTFKLQYGSLKTTALAYNISAANIQVALRLLAPLAAVTVTGTMATAVVVTLAGTPFPNHQLAVIESSLIVSGTADAQTVSFGGVTPEVGSYRLRFRFPPNQINIDRTVETNRRPYNDTAGNLQTYLRRLLGDASLTVTGTFAGGLVISNSVTGKGRTIEVFENKLEVLDESIQTLAFTQTVDQGSFKLGWGGGQTTAIPYTADAAAVQAALRLIVGLERVTVTGSFGANFVVTFVGVSKKNVQKFSVHQNSLATAQILNLTANHVPTIGAFSLMYGPTEVGPFQFGVLDSAIQTALRLIPALAAVTCVGDFTGGFVITMLGVSKPLAMSIKAGFTTKVDGTHEVQHIAFSATPDAGSFAITYGGNQTALIPNDAAAADVQAALRAIAGMTGIVVTGSYAAGFTLTFPDSGDKVQITIATNTLTHTTTPVTKTITTTTPGTADVVATPALAVGTAFAATVITRTISHAGGPAAVVSAVARTTPGVDDVGVLFPDTVITTPGDRALDKEGVLQGASLDRSTSAMQGNLYLFADTALPVRVVEVF